VIKCTIKRAALLRFILLKGNKATFSDLEEVIGRVSKSKRSLQEMLRYAMKIGLISFNEYGEFYVTRKGLEYLERCKNRWM